MSATTSPLLTASVHAALLQARRAGAPTLTCSLDLGRSTTTIDIGAEHWTWNQRDFPYLEVCRDRTIYHWLAQAAESPSQFEPVAHFEPVARFTTSLIKLVPTPWGPPTFEIDGIKMLPSAHVSPCADAERKVGLIEPRGKRILDTCGGLGYFAACCLQAQAAHVQSCEKSPDVLWLRSLNPWSPDSPWWRTAAPATSGILTLAQVDVTSQITQLPDASVDAILHDPPRFGIAGELYSQTFYDQLARVLKRRGLLFHYTGTPNKVSRGRDLAFEVATRLRRAGFTTAVNGDGILATAAA